MATDTEVCQAYRGLQLSTKEMLKHNRRQQYCRMIQLLTDSCKATGLMSTSFTNDELVEFWLGDVLPLMFDTDRDIQNCAVTAIAEALVALDVAVIHDSKYWAHFRTDAVNKYITQIGEMREAKNKNWHKIWCLLVQIMDNELLRGTAHINKFLAIVELGFRNPDNNIRAEAFLCWRVLIKIFAAYNELATAKRLRLVLIPLRTSQSRSSHVSCIKLRVWWYLLHCMDAEMPNSFDNAVEFFLSYMLGGGSKNVATGLAQNYQAARELALPCLVALWNMEVNSQALQRILQDQRLEVPLQPSPLMDAKVMSQHWRPMLQAAVAGMQLLNPASSSSEKEQEVLHLLIKNITLAVLQLRIWPFTVAACAELEKTLTTDGSIARIFFNTLSTATVPATRTDALDVLEAYMKLCLKARTEVPQTILQRSIMNIYGAEQLEVHGTSEFRLLREFAELLMNSTAEDEDFESFNVRLQIWRQVSLALLTYLRINPLEYRVAQNAKLLDSWILWPLQTSVSFAGKRANSPFDGNFCEQWRQLINAGHNSNSRKQFVVDLKTALMELLTKHSSKEEPLFAELFDAYSGSVLKLGICKDAPLYKDIFGVLQAVFERPNVTQPLLEGCLNTLRNLLMELRQNELMVIFDALKPTLAAAMQCWTKCKCEGSFLQEWKRAIQERFRKLPMKNMSNQLKELFKGDELFVIIPSVWSLNPDKLTERQKERFAEKSDIPALYNDMSQSQDASIKPWTPKKVVIAKGKQSEVALVGEKDAIETVVIEESPPPEVSPEEPPATPTRRRQVTEAEFSNVRRLRSKSTDESLPKTTSPATPEDTPGRLTRNRAAQKDNKEPVVPTTDKLRSPRKQNPSGTTAAAASKVVPAATVTTSQKVKETAPSKATTMQSEDLFAESSTQSLVARQLLPAEKPSSVPETQLVAATETDELLFAEPTTNAIESSPKRSSTRLGNLSSPPDRKLTNNSSSPTLHPKPSSHLTGRGARLINMIRNKKLDASAACTSLTNSQSHSSGVNRILHTPARALDRTDLVSTPTVEVSELALEQTSTPIQQVKELLIFSKRLPSPSASPSASILKRKLRCESMDDFESPAMKRKRVSFHDPPVSVTKEYLRDADVEMRSNSKPKRCLIMPPTTTEVRSALKRRGRLDSIIEIEKFAHEQTAKNVATDKSLDKSSDAADDEALDTLRWNETTATEGNVSESKVQEEEPLPARDLAILDADAALDLVVEQCSLDTVLERYFAHSNSSSSLKTALIMTKFLSNQMKQEKLKKSVLETLSENHSKEFLDHAVRENLSSVVCDRLNLNSVLDYICAKSKINNSCRTNLLAQIPPMVRQEPERMEFIQQLLQQGGFSDEQLLDLIGQLMQLRNKPNGDSNTGNSGTVDTVAETAADSSSNL